MLAYREINLAVNGTDEQRQALGDLTKLPRPWIPTTCAEPDLRTELWNWLEAAVTWLNHEYVFDPVDMIPACWPRHPHLIHEIAVIVDHRWRAETALTSGDLEEWHRYALPAFLERMRHRCAQHCDDQHPTTPPSRGRFARHLGDIPASSRQAAFASDIHSLSTSDDEPTTAARLRLVDTDTGEVL